MLLSPSSRRLVPSCGSSDPSHKRPQTPTTLMDAWWAVGSRKLIPGPDSLEGPLLPHPGAPSTYPCHSWNPKCICLIPASRKEKALSGSDGAEQSGGGRGRET